MSDGCQNHDRGQEGPRKPKSEPPAHKPSEVIAMRERYPELLSRALEIERRGAETTRQKRGLGGENNYWSDWLAAHDAQEKLFDLEPMHIPCGCSE